MSQRKWLNLIFTCLLLQLLLFYFIEIELMWLMNENILKINFVLYHFNVIATWKWIFLLWVWWPNGTWRQVWPKCSDIHLTFESVSVAWLVAVLLLVTWLVIKVSVLSWCIISGVCGKPQQTKTNIGHPATESGEACGIPNSFPYWPIRRWAI